MSTSELAAEQLRADAFQEVNAAEAAVEEGRRLIAEGERRVEEGEAAVAEARMQLRFADRFIAKVRRLEAERAAADAAPAAAAVVVASAANGSAPTTNVGRSMVPVLDDIMSDAAERTVDEIVAIMRSRGHTWTRESVVNRCAARAKSGAYVRRVREDGKSAYKLAANSGDQLPSGLADPEGGRESQPEEDSQLGAGEVGQVSGLSV